MSESKRYISESVRRLVVDLHDKLEKEGRSVPEHIQTVYEYGRNNVKTSDQETLSGAMKELKDAGYFKLPGDDARKKLQEQLQEGYQELNDDNQ